MSIGTLAAIITKTRQLSNSGTTSQLTNQQIIDYINSFYLYDFPAQYRALKLQDKVTFNTIKGIDTYAFDSEHFSTVQMPCYCAGREIKLFNDPWSFFGVNFNWFQQQNLTSGDGTAGPYSGTCQSTPILRSTSNNPITQTKTQSTSVFPINYQSQFTQDANIGRVQNILITVNRANGDTLNVTDDGAGNLIGNCISGTINYSTGAVSNLVFSNTVPSGETITIEYNSQVLAIPQGVMFYQNQFTMRPVPDKGYTITLTAYRLPSQALLGSGTVIDMAGVPEQIEWWETLAFGAAKKIYEDRLDPDGVALMDKALREHYALNETRTYAQLGKNRMPTLFADQLSYNYGSGGFGFGSNG